MTIRSRRRHRGPTSVRLSLCRFEDRVVPALTVSGVAPLQLPANVTLFPGLWLATLSDSDGNTDVSKYTGTIDWGDGQTTGATFNNFLPPGVMGAPSVSGPVNVFGNHKYAAAGTYTIHISIQDSDGDTGQANDTVNVFAPSPLQSIPPSSLQERANEPFSGVVAEFTDSDGTLANGNFTATIDWGDGQSSAGNVGVVLPPSLGTGGSPFFEVMGGHTYAAAGSYSVHVTIHDVDGDTLQVDNSAQVRPEFVHYYAVASGPGLPPDVKVYDAVTGAFKFDLKPYDASFLGGVRVAIGDVNGDGVDDIVTAAGPGGGPHVKVFDGVSGLEFDNGFYAYDPSFAGGVYVAVADIDGDGHGDVITGAGPGGGPHVKAFSGATIIDPNRVVLRSFFAYGGGFTGGVTVAAGDVNGDGKADIITGAGPGGGPHVKAFGGADGSLLDSFYAYDKSFAGGVFVAVGDVNGDGRTDIITGTGEGGAPHVKAFSGIDLSVLHSFYAYDDTFAGGVRVGSADLNGDGRDDILTGLGPGEERFDVFYFDDKLRVRLPILTSRDPSELGGLYVGGGT